MSQLSTGHQIAMDYFVFAKIKGYYLLLEDDCTPDTMTVSNSQFFSASTLEPVVCAKTVAADSLFEIFGTNINFPQSQYSVSSVDNYLLLIPLSSLRVILSFVTIAEPHLGRQRQLFSAPRIPPRPLVTQP